MEIIKQKVENEKYKNKYLTVWFNAWQYEKEEHPIVPLIAVIIKALQNEKGEIKKGFEKFVDVLRSVAYGFSMETTNKDVLGNELKMQLNSKDMMDKYEQLVASALLDKSLYFNAFEKLETLDELGNKRIIVFIDDLDRCLPPNAIKLLESIKLVLSQKGFVFILGVAKEVLEGHLNHKYAKEFGIEGGNHGKAYLEKMIQLPFTLPKFTQKVDSLVDSLFAKVEHKDDVSNIKEVITAIAIHSKVTPRLLVRLINQAKIHAEIDKELENLEIYNDMYAAFVFVLLFDTLYENEYKIFSVLTEESLSKVLKEVKFHKKTYDLSKNISNIANKTFKSFSGIDFETTQKEEDLNDDLSIAVKAIKDNSCLEKLLLSKIGQDWLGNIDLRERTIEFVDIATNTSDEEIKKQEEKRLKNQSLEDIKNEQERLFEKVVDDKTFNKEILNIDSNEPLYKTLFVKVTDEEGKEFEISKFLVTNKWFREFIPNHNLENKHDYKPVGKVSYNEAIKFCEWLEDEYYSYSIPSKTQLEYLMKSANKYVKYPWGDKFDSKKCNNGNIGLESTSIVGAFSRYGGDSQIEGIKNQICDLTGNVLKWTSTNLKNEEKIKILKGGSCTLFREEYFSALCNGNQEIDTKYNGIGFYIIRTKK
ncbi:P-loop NTPase fold protein [Arcobacter sp. LA11]|uniref:P-loop NTPase fold protein n=1 Tax=Arcobacter sp. LA11 TaxID=1898176 RepID=UPI0011603D1E|nr:P-loop NTPase fold protein [Arcobacter sp. LA11]